MNPQEIEEKMNLDESQCCPRRSKRKRRRLESNSEEEDETYSPSINGIPVQVKHVKHIKRKQLRRPISHSTTNGIVTREIQSYTNRIPIPIRPRPTSFLSGQSLNAEPPKSAASHKNSAIAPSENIVISPPSVINSNTSLPSRFDPNALQQQHSVYHTSFMNTQGSTTYIQSPVTMNPTTRIILSPQSQPQLYQPQQGSSYQSPQASSYQPSQASSYQPLQASSYQPSQASSYQPSLQSSPNTMVSIPNPVDKHGRPLFILPKPKEVDITLTPNIIELDSDSDNESVAQQNNFIDLTSDRGNNMDINSSPDKVVPVALTWENGDDDSMNEEQPLRVIHSTVKKNVSFSGMMLPHSQELDKLLTDAKEQVYSFFDLNNTIENIEVEAQQRIKHFYYNMRDTVFQLVHINDRIIRQYIDWRKSQKTETEALSSVNENALESSQENIDIPLDMTCVNDSDTEDCEDQGYQIMEPSDLVKNSSIIKDLLFCKKTVVHRGVGNDSAHLSMDKAIQVYDVVSRDYEKSIGYSMITKTVHDSKTDDSLNSPIPSDKNFGKYEEQFIFYLQHIEDNGIETEDTRNLADSDETSFQEMDPPFISHLFQNIDLSVVSTNTDADQSKNCQQEKNLSDSIDSVTKNDKSDTLDKNNEKLINNSDTKIQETNMQLDDKLQQTESRKTHAPDTTDNETVIIDSEANSNKNGSIINNIEIVSSESEEDCTIIID